MLKRSEKLKKNFFIDIEMSDINPSGRVYNLT